MKIMLYLEPTNNDALEDAIHEAVIYALDDGMQDIDDTEVEEWKVRAECVIDK